MARRSLAFGFSPCPNDTFAFWAAVHDRVPAPAVQLLPGMIADIEALNRRAVDGPDPLPVTKLSLPALAAVTERYAVLPAGAALGFGVGPLVVCRPDGPRALAALRGCRIAVPGRYTTASLLLTLFGPRDVTLVEAPFARVMPLVAAGECDAGLVIHEGRFTYEGHGLLAIADLGELWQQATGLPLPLGVIAIQRHLGPDLYAGVGALLRASVALAQRDPAATRAFVREHSQELADDVCARHIALYVNAFTLDLGDTGRAAIDELLRRGRAAGHLPAGTSPWWEGR